MIPMRGVYEAAIIATLSSEPGALNVPAAAAVVREAFMSEREETPDFAHKHEFDPVLWFVGIQEADTGPNLYKVRVKRHRPADITPAPDEFSDSWLADIGYQFAKCWFTGQLEQEFAFAFSERGAPQQTADELDAAIRGRRLRNRFDWLLTVDVTRIVLRVDEALAEVHT